MKKLYLIIMLQLFSLITYAQLYQPANWQKEKIVFKGYTILLRPSIGATYGYDVIKGSRVLIHQRNNPFTMSPAGFRNKQDAYKVAKWQVSNFFTNTNPRSTTNIVGNKKPFSGQHAISKPPLINQPLSKKIAEQLQIKIL